MRQGLYCVKKCMEDQKTPRHLKHVSVIYGVRAKEKHPFPPISGMDIHGVIDTRAVSSTFYDAGRLGRLTIVKHIQDKGCQS